MSATPPGLTDTQDPRDLHERLHSAAPTTYPGLDLDAAISSGRRTIRRRRIATTAVAALAVAAVAVGGTALRGRPSAAPQPGGTSTPSATSAPLSLAGTVTMSIPAQSVDGTGPTGGVDSGQHNYEVTTKPDGKGGLLVTYAQTTPTGGRTQLGQSTMSPPLNRTTFVVVPQQRLILGLIPSVDTLTYLNVRTSPELGSYGSFAEPVPGTGYSAFAVTSQKAVTSSAAVREILWFDHLGRPVDIAGTVGYATTAGGRPVWLSADGTTLGTQGFTTLTSSGKIPYLAGSIGPTVEGGGTSTAAPDIDVTVLAPAQAISGTLRLDDGRAVPFASTTPLSPKHSVIALSLPVSAGKYVDIVSMTWVDAAGASHTLTN